MSGSEFTKDLARFKPEEVAIYVRCSKKEMQQKSFNAGEQIISIRNWIDRQGAQQPPKSMEFVDLDFTRSSFDNKSGTKRRAAFAQVENLIVTGQVKAILVYHLSRFIGNVGLQSDMISWLQEEKVMLIGTTENTEWTHPRNEFFAGLLGVMNQHEVAEVTRRITLRMRSLRAQGWFLGGPVPFAYDLIKVGPHSSLKPKPEGSPERIALVDCFESYLRGESYAGLERMLKTRYGITVSKSGMKRKLRSRVWLGQQPSRWCKADPKHRTHKEVCPECGDETEVQEAKWQAVIDEDLWLAVQEKVSFNRDKLRGQRKNFYLLSQLLVDAEYGLNMGGTTSRKEDRPNKATGEEWRRSYYYITDKRYTGLADFPKLDRCFVPCEDVDALVRQKFKELGSSRAAIRSAVMEYNSGFVDVKASTSVRTKLVKQAEGLQQEIDFRSNAITRALRTGNTAQAEQHDERMAELSFQLTAVNEQLESVGKSSIPLKAGPSDLDGVQAFMEAMPKHFDWLMENDPKSLKQLLNSCIDRIDFDVANHQVTIQWNPDIMTNPPPVDKSGPSGGGSQDGGSKGSGSVSGKSSGGKAGSSASKASSQVVDLSTNLDVQGVHHSALSVSTVVPVPQAIGTILEHLSPTTHWGRKAKKRRERLARLKVHRK